MRDLSDPHMQKLMWQIRSNKRDLAQVEDHIARRLDTSVYVYPSWQWLTPDEVQVCLAAANLLGPFYAQP